MSASERYWQRTGKRYVYNIMPIRNIASVLGHGIVCYDKIKQIAHYSIAMPEVQKRREMVQIPNGFSLHKYANLYFSYANPMLYLRREQAETLCILAVSSLVLDMEGTLVSDRNAAVGLARFYTPLEGMERLDFSRIHARFWTNDDPIVQRANKAIKCAEVLVPDCVPATYIEGAYVVNENARVAMEQQGFSQRIHVNSGVFFR